MKYSALQESQARTRHALIIVKAYVTQELRKECGNVVHDSKIYLRNGAAINFNCDARDDGEDVDFSRIIKYKVSECLKNEDITDFNIEIETELNCDTERGYYVMFSAAEKV